MANLPRADGPLVATLTSSLPLAPNANDHHDLKSLILTTYSNTPVLIRLTEVVLQIKISSRELNEDLRAGRSVDHDVPLPPPKAITPGGPGSSWRMMRLRRVYETAEEENKPIEEVALERFGTLQAFEEAKAERQLLDERDGRRSQRRDETKERGRGREGGGEKRFMFTDVGASGASSRSSSFRRPGSGPTGSAPSTPSPANPPTSRRFDSLRLPSQAASPLAQSHTPIPSVITPSVATTSTHRAMSPSSLNKLQAQVLRARLVNAPNAEKLEEEYEAEVRRSKGEEGGVRTRVEVLPTLNVTGQMYDVGHGKDDAEKGPGNRKKKEKVGFWTLEHGTAKHILDSSKPVILRQENCSGITLTMMTSHWGRW
jgi:hypothetical protein